MKIHGFQKYFDFEDEKICQVIEPRGVTVSEEDGRLLLLAEEHVEKAEQELRRKETLPKAQRTRGLTSTYQSNFFGSYHNFKHKS